MTPALAGHLATVAVTAAVVLAARSAWARRRYRRDRVRRERLLARVVDEPSRMVVEAGCQPVRGQQLAPNARRPPKGGGQAPPPKVAGWCSHGDHCTHHPKET